MPKTTYNTLKLFCLILATLAGFCCDVFRVLLARPEYENGPALILAAGCIICSTKSTPPGRNYSAFKSVLRAFCGVVSFYTGFIFAGLYGAASAVIWRFMRSYHASPATFCKLSRLAAASGQKTLCYICLILVRCFIYGTPLYIVVYPIRPQYIDFPKTRFFRGVCAILENLKTQKPRQG